jgi:protein phosphatase 1 regulatory subunit 7
MIDQNMSSFCNLKILSIQSNRITKLEGLEGLTALEELYISHNGLTKLEGLEKNVSLDKSSQRLGNRLERFILDSQEKLRVLDIGNNMIEKIENISHLKQLEEFWVRLLSTRYNSLACTKHVMSNRRAITRSRISMT